MGSGNDLLVPQTFFGDGSDGVLDLNTTLELEVEEEDVSTVVKQYESVHIRSGGVLTVDKRCRGLFIYSQGDVIIDGLIDMNYKSPFVADSVPPHVLSIPDPDNTRFLDMETPLLVIGPGGRGGRGGGSFVGGVSGEGIMPGGAPVGLCFFGGGRGGGGAGGGSTRASTNLRGFPGGRGGDGTQHGTHEGGSGTSSSGEDGGLGGSGGGGARRGGKGGNSNNGGGAGGGGGWEGGEPGEDAIGSGGGLVVIVARGDVIINGIITAQGARGGNGGDRGPSKGDDDGVRGGGGGGNGGGVVTILHAGWYANNGTINVDGGAGGTGYEAGASGQIGKIEVIRVVPS